MKTPEEMDRLELLAASYAYDYRDSPNKTNGIPDSYLVYSIAYDAFLDGYKAAMDQLADADKAMSEMEQFAEVVYADMPMAKKAFLRGYRETKAKLNVSSSQWIRVKDRLPNKEQAVIWWNDGNKQMMIEDLYGVSVDDDEEAMKPLNFITHWMPLPEPPKEEK